MAPHTAERAVVDVSPTDTNCVGDVTGLLKVIVNATESPTLTVEFAGCGDVTEDTVGIT